MEVNGEPLQSHVRVLGATPRTRGGPGNHLAVCPGVAPVLIDIIPKARSTGIESVVLVPALLLPVLSHGRGALAFFFVFPLRLLRRVHWPCACPGRGLPQGARSAAPRQRYAATRRAPPKTPRTTHIDPDRPKRNRSGLPKSAARTSTTDDARHWIFRYSAISCRERAGIYVIM